MKTIKELEAEKPKQKLGTVGAISIANQIQALKDVIKLIDEFNSSSIPPLSELKARIEG